MLEKVRRLIAVLPPRRRHVMFGLLALYVAVAFLQAASVASIGPFIAVALDPAGRVAGDGILADAYARLGFTTPRKFLAALGAISASLIVLAQVAYLFAERIRVRWMFGCQADIARLIFQNFLGRPYEFFATRHSGSIHTVVIGEAQQMASQFLIPMIDAVTRAVMVLFMIAMTLLIDVGIALVAALAVAAVIAAVVPTTSGRLRRTGAGIRHWNEVRFTTALEVFCGVKELKLRGHEARAARQFAEASRRLSGDQASATFLRTLPRPIIEAVLFAGIVIAVTVAAMGDGTLVAFIPKAATFLVAGYRIVPSAQSALASVQNMRVGEAALDSVLAELAVPTPAERRLADVPLAVREAVRGFRTLRLAGVAYAYPGAAEPALAGVDLTVRRNACIGVVGRSGAGKSTLMDVMLGLLAPTSGTLEVDGTVLAGDALLAWRGEVGYVAQTIFLADDTIAANVAFGDAAPDPARVARAVRLAALEGTVAALPAGLATRIGEGGARLSGGQRQRLAIARALYDDPAILFLDEATSALDGATEAAIMAELKALVGTRTIVVIAHRLSTLSICDEVVELAAGRVVRVVPGGEFAAAAQ